MTYTASVDGLASDTAFTETRTSTEATARMLTEALGGAEAALGSVAMSMAVSSAVVALLGDLRTAYGAMGSLERRVTDAGANYRAAEDAAVAQYGAIHAS